MSAGTSMYIVSLTLVLEWEVLTVAQEAVGGGGGGGGEGGSCWDKFGEFFHQEEEKGTKGRNYPETDLDTSAPEHLKRDLHFLRICHDSSTSI